MHACSPNTLIRCPVALNSTCELNESDFDYHVLNVPSYILNDAEYIRTNDSAQYIGQTLTCDSNNSNRYCIVECNDVLSCAFSTIYFDGEVLSDVVVHCSDSFSCIGANILVESSTSIQHTYPYTSLGITIICDGEDSCNELTVNVTDVSSFNLYCAATGSCQEVAINHEMSPGAMQYNPPGDFDAVHCVLPEVCNDLKIDTTVIDNFKLFMYEFSRGVVLNNGFGYISDFGLNIECNTNRWLQFDGVLLTNSTVIQSVHNEYENELFPCADVEVQCGWRQIRSCFMTYKFIGNDIVEKFSNDSDLAFPINMNDLYQLTCNGECYEPPTESPTSSPTNSPTASPSPGPTMEPSTSPTFAPTSKDDYDYYVEALFEIGDINKSEIIDIANSLALFIGNISYSITAGFDANRALEFQDVWVNISEINQFGTLYLIEHPDVAKFNFLKDDHLDLKSYIKCSLMTCDYICDDPFEWKPFQRFIESNIQQHYGSDFSVSVMEISGPFELYPPPDEIDYIFYVLLGFVGVFVIIALCAFIFNEGLVPTISPCHQVDSGKWTAVLSFATQFYDFVGDISFSVDVWRTWFGLEDVDTETSRMIFASAIGSTSFIIIPYFANLYSASKIKGKQGVIGRNSSAQIWFTSYSSIFTLFVMLSGSTYTATQMISSNIFGLKWLNCGLTQFELKQMFHLKVLNNVFLENVPQLFFLALYTQNVGGMSDAAWFSLIGSVLSVLATSLMYFIDRDRGDNLLPIEYYLSIQCDRKLTDQNSTASKCGSDLTEMEQKRIEKHSGMTLALSRGIAKIWGTQYKAFEIGCTLVKIQGAVIHMIQYLDRSEFELFAAEHSNDSNVNPMSFVRAVFTLNKSEITNLIQTHFELDHCFNVSLLDPVQRKSSVSPTEKSQMLQTMKTLRNMKQFGDEEQRKMESLILNYFEIGSGSKEDKRRKIEELMLSAEAEAKPLLQENDERTETVSPRSPNSTRGKQLLFMSQSPKSFVRVDRDSSSDEEGAE